MKAHQFPSERLAGVILAAGASSRMGRDKALLTLGPETFLSATIKRLKPFTGTVIVVAGTNAASLRPIATAEGADLVSNPHPERGQFSSLRVGLRRVLDRGLHTAILTHVDRPAAAVATVKRLLTAFAEQSSATAAVRKWAVVPEFEGTHGHPIIAGREMIDAFMRASEQLTARDVEHAHQERILYLTVPDENVVLNVNTPEEYQALLERKET